MPNEVFHEGSMLFIKGSDRKIVIETDMDFNEACLYMLDMSKQDTRISPVVRKTLLPIRKVRRQTGTGWPKS